MKTQNRSEFKRGRIIALFAVPVLALMAAGVSAEETTGEKIENKIDEVKKDTKVNARKAKKKIREVTCTDADRASGKCAMEDAADTAANVKDEVQHEAKKLKNKID